MPNIRVHFLSRSQEWATPWNLFRVLDRTLGPYTLDPCATAENAKCRLFYTEKENGLMQDWSREKVFMNPPYGREIGHWIGKAFTESQRGAVVSCLVPARTDTSWWHKYIMKAERVILLRGRVRFISPEGNSSPAPFPSAVAHFVPGFTGSAPAFSTLDIRGF